MGFDGTSWLSLFLVVQSIITFQFIVKDYTNWNAKNFDETSGKATGAEAHSHQGKTRDVVVSNQLLVAALLSVDGHMDATIIMKGGSLYKLPSPRQSRLRSKPERFSSNPNDIPFPLQHTRLSEDFEILRGRVEAISLLTGRGYAIVSGKDTPSDFAICCRSYVFKCSFHFQTKEYIQGGETCQLVVKSVPHSCEREHHKSFVPERNKNSFRNLLRAADLPTGGPYDESDLEYLQKILSESFGIDSFSFANRKTLANLLATVTCSEMKNVTAACAGDEGENLALSDDAASSGDEEISAHAMESNVELGRYKAGLDATEMELVSRSPAISKWIRTIESNRTDTTPKLQVKSF